MSFKLFLLVGINLAENVYKINLSTDNRKIYVANFVLYNASFKPTQYYMSTRDLNRKLGKSL